MIKDIMTANESAAPNSREMEILKEHFPSCFRLDGSFDLGRFQEYLSDKIAVVNEGYELKFLGKNYARLLASMDTATVIVPDLEHNRRPENANSKNVYISGDNLDGLKYLLKSYAKKVKCIYIDPPYNTGSDGFVYADQFHFTPDELSEKLSISTGQAQRILDLTKRSSASHSAWLTFMYPRLLLARDLLADQGVIFLSIDDNEQANLKLLCDDVFGAENIIGTILWKKKTNGNNMGIIPPVHDYILAYARDIERVGEIGYDFTDEYFRQTFSNPDHDPRGPWTTTDLSANHKGPYFKITNPVTGQEFFPPDGRYWVFNEKEVLHRIKEGRIIFGKSGTARPCQKVFAAERTFERARAESWWDSHGMNEDATEELRNLFGQSKLFSHPKPTKLLKHILRISTDSKTEEPQIIVDFFSGSGTTADAVMQLNAEDGAKRQFIAVQLPESLDGKLSKREAAGESSPENQISFLDACDRPHTVDQLGIERLIRTAETIRKETPSTTADLGFQHFTLAEPSGPTLDKLERFSPDDNGLAVADSILDCFGVPTVLATWLVRDGYGFTAPVKAIDFAGSTGYYMDKHLYLIEPGLSNAAIAAITDKFETDGTFNPENVVMFGYSFQWTETESLKTNLARLRVTEKNLRINFDIRY